MRSKTGRYSGASRGAPLTFEKIWTPVAPSSPMARSISRTAASGWFIGSDATKPGKRSGCRPTISAMPSLARRARSAASSGPAYVSSGGEQSVSTCTYPS